MGFFERPNASSRRDDARNARSALPTARAFPPRRDLDDVELMKGDALVLWFFALVQKTAAAASAPSFPGWLAPVTLDPISFASFIAETVWVTAAWVACASAIGAYELQPAGKTSEEGEMENAVKGAARGWAVFCFPAFVGVTSIRKIIAEGSATFVDGDAVAFGAMRAEAIPHSFPVPVTLALVLLLMVSWRAYVKVIGLLGWWRPNRTPTRIEDEAWKYLRHAQILAVLLAIGMAAVEFAGGGGGPAIAGDGW